MADLIRRSDVIGLLEDMLLFGEYEIIASSFSKADEEKAYRAINDIPAVNRWISVEDALPEIGYNVLVTRQTESNARYTRIASLQDDCWMDNTDEYGKPNPNPVIAWMPMPDAYEPPQVSSQASTVEQQPIKYGWWEDCSNGFMCSSCHVDNIKDSKYCPDCGSKMSNGR